MSQKVIKISRALDLFCSLDLSCTLSKLDEFDEYIFDFNEVGTTEPFGMLLVSSEINRLISKHPKSKFACTNFQRMKYAGNMGFFKAFGLNHGKNPGEAKGNTRFLPITLVNCKELRDKAYEEGVYVGDVIENYSKELSEILCGENFGNIFDTLTYSIREIIRNVVEHSESNQLGICAQYWPSKNKVEVAILDRGVGLQKTLKNNPHLEVVDNKSAINYALMPAVSGKAFKGARQRQKGPWANSGFGLYMTSRICRNGGTFFVATGDKGMLLTKGAGGKRYLDCCFDGTAIRMVIKTKDIPAIKEALEQYRNEGYKIQSTYAEIAQIDPSSASLMLSEDFDLSVWDRMLIKLRGN